MVVRVVNKKTLLNRLYIVRSILKTMVAYLDEKVISNVMRLLLAIFRFSTEDP